jgi:hypothetical protein
MIATTLIGWLDQDRNNCEKRTPSGVLVSKIKNRNGFPGKAHHGISIYAEVKSVSMRI